MTEATLETKHFMTGAGLAQTIHVPLGSTIEGIALHVYGSCEHVTAWLRMGNAIDSEWAEVPQCLWRHIKPKLGGVVRFGARPGKSVWNAILTVVAIVITAVVAPYLTALVGKVGASLISGAFLLGTSVALNALFPSSSSTTTATTTDEDASTFNNVDSDSNVLAKNSYLPRVAGTRRISPPEITAPYFSMDNGTQILERLFALDGHHALSDVQIDGTDTGEYERITTEIQDGAEDSPTETFITKVSNYKDISETLSSFDLEDTVLVDQEDPGNSEPLAIRTTTIYDSKMEEIKFRLQLSGMYKTDSASASIRFPLRLRFRPKGSSGDWYNLPEIHVTGRDVSTLLKEIRIRWDSDFGSEAATGSLGYQFFQTVPASSKTLSDGNTGVQWQCHEYFAGSTTALTSVSNISGNRDGIRVVLDAETFPLQEYEWEIQRGLALAYSGITTSTYAISGTVYSLFVAYYSDSQWVVPVDQGAYVPSVTVGFVSTLVNRTPCQRPGTALLALKSTGQTTRNITVLAQGYAYDWDGEGWNNLTLTDNPATHFRQVLSDVLNYFGVDTDLIDDNGISAWWQECEDRGYRVSYSMAGGSLRDVLYDIAAAGFARPVMSEKFSVDYFRDRSDEIPVQTFSPRNSSITATLAAPSTPVGIRAQFNNEDDDYSEDEREVNNPFATNFQGYSVTEYPSIADPDLIDRRAYFDVLQSVYQGRRTWNVEAPIEGFVCERGDLVGIITDLAENNGIGTRIRSMLSGTTFTIDQLPTPTGTESLFDVDNIFDPDDIFQVGEESSALVSTPDGTVMGKVVIAAEQAEGFVVRLDTDLASPSAYQLLPEDETFIAALWADAEAGDLPLFSVYYRGLRQLAVGAAAGDYTLSRGDVGTLSAVQQAISDGDYSLGTLDLIRLSTLTSAASLGYSLRDLKGAHIIIGPTSHLVRRCIVAEVTRTSEERATLTCYDEAPEIYEQLNLRYPS